MITEQDFVIISYNKERDISAEYFAMQKFLYKHLSLTVKDIIEREIESLKMEFLSEFAFMEYLLSLLDENFKGMKWDINKIELAGKDAILAGIYDDALQKTITEKTITLKTFTIQKVSAGDISQLFFTASKLEFPKANLYVQCFVLKNNDIVLAGYSKDIPSIKEPANVIDYTISINKLMKMSNFINEFK